MRWRLADGPQDLRGFGLLAAPVLPELERNSASDVLHRLNAYIGMGAMTRSCQSNWEYPSDPWLTERDVAHETRLYAGDHGIPTAMQDDFLAWFERIV